MTKEQQITHQDNEYIRVPPTAEDAISMGYSVCEEDDREYVCGEMIIHTDKPADGILDE